MNLRWHIRYLLEGAILVNEFTMHVMENHRASLKVNKRVWQVEGTCCFVDTYSNLGVDFLMKDSSTAIW